MAIPDNYIDKITKGNDSRMISPAADMVRVNNDNFDGETLDDVLDDVAQAISEAGKVKSVTINGTNHTPNSSGVVDLGTIKGEKGDKGDTGNVTVTDGVAQITIVNDLTTGGTGDALSAEMGKKLKVTIITILNSLGNYAFPDGKPVIDWGDDTPVTYAVSKTIGTGLSATGGDTDVEMGDTLEVAIAITNNLYIIDEDSVVVTMGGQPVAGAWDSSTMKVTIAAVTGNVVINVPSLTYVNVNNNLAFHLDCMNRGGTSGHWKDLIGNIDFTLGSAVVASDSGVVFDGSANSYGETNSALTIAPSAGTIEAVVVGASGEYNPIFINPVASGDNDNIGLCIFNWSAVEKIATMSMRYPGSNVPTVNCSADTGSVNDFALSLSNQKYMNKGVGSVPRKNYSFLMNTAHTKLTIGRSRRPVGDSRGDVVFIGTIKAIRIYNTVLTEAQQQQNWKVDQKRFNIS
jgi:hypothetical protein